ncbi:MAG: DUF5681 domain-containing protein [Afipia sp.]|nr:DUF5681 domain-containing protein [Afipia sp.]
METAVSQDEDDGVGYRRPPKSGQFRPGQSGNPKGRKKRVANFKTDLTEELSETITIRENGRERRISKQRAFVKALMALAIKGDIRAINALVACTRNFGAGNDGGAGSDDVDMEDLDIIENYLGRERQRRSRAHDDSAQTLNPKPTSRKKGPPK